MTPPAIGAILAGGLARRLGGGDKAMCGIGGRPVLTRLIDRLAPQVTGMVLNANDDPGRFAGFGLAVVADSLADHPGPLAGVLAALEWAAAEALGTEWVVTVPCDTPFLPTDLVARLHAARLHAARLQVTRIRDDATIVCAASAGRTHPVIALWNVSLAAALRRAVAEQGVRSVSRFIGRYAVTVVDWGTDPVDPFFNINTPEDLAEADRLANAYPGL